jgi:hypothetical protein
LRPVKNTSELQRVLALPRRPANGGPELEELRHLLTQHLRVPGGTATLLPIQAFALRDLYETGGLFGPIGVGHGKGLLSILAPVVGVEGRQIYKPLLLVPAALREQTIREVIPKFRPHFRLHRNLRIESYNFLSSPDSALFLDQYVPDMIILDEAHMLKDPDSARTKRFLRFMAEHPDTVLVVLSGTMTTKSLLDFWHLCKHSIKGFRCPMPLLQSVTKEWDAAIGAGSSWAHNEPMAPGALEAFCGTGENGVRENVRQGFRRRLLETPGVVGTSESAIGTSLVVSRRDVKVPEVISKALQDLRRTQKTAWGEEVEDPLALHRHARQLAMGFYYRWKWPDGVPDLEWLNARADWHREIRYWLKRDIPGCDSPLLVTNAVMAGRLESEFWPKWDRVRERYKPHPPVEAVWLSDFLVHDVVRWLQKNDGIAWTEHTAVLERLRQYGVNVFGSGDEDAARILTATGPIAASVKAHGTGKNLQRWCKNLVLSCPSSGATWQQLLARTHRIGQEADEVSAEVFQHTAELEDAWLQALNTAGYLDDLTDPNKLLLATHAGFSKLAA